MKDFLTKIYIEYKEAILEFLPKFLMSLVVFLIFLCCAWVVNRIFHTFSKKAQSERAKVYQLLGNVFRTTLIVIGIITALGTMGVDVSALVAGLGLTGFALGFALKDAISNLLSGLLILFYQPFKIGQKIKVSGCEGAVMDVNLRYTTLDGDGQHFIIPNSVCFNNWIAIDENYVPQEKEKE